MEGESSAFIPVEGPRGGRDWSTDGVKKMWKGKKGRRARKMKERGKGRLTSVTLITENIVRSFIYCLVCRPPDNV